MDPVDLASFKTATIEAVELDDAKKTAALADFDSCMEATESVPFSFFSFRKEKIPPLLQNYTYYYQIQFGFDRLSPSPSIRAIDCMETVLMQNVNLSIKSFQSFNKFNSICLSTFRIAPRRRKMSSTS